MTKVKAKTKQGGQSAGKHPTRVPVRSTTPSSPFRHKQVRMRSQEVSSSHRMTTRSRAKYFRFMDLPPEIRSLIYTSAFHDSNEPLDLQNFKLSQLLSVSNVVRAESLPVFFSSVAFTASFRSNWCVRNNHFHSSEYMRHHDSGILKLSPHLVDAERRLPQQAVRFHNVKFGINCVCCIKAVEIGNLHLRVADRHPTFDAALTTSNAETKKVWPIFVKAVEGKVKQIGERQAFVGFTTEDLRDLAMCFRCHQGSSHGSKS